MDFIQFYHVLIYISYLFLKKKELRQRKIRFLLKKSLTLAMIDLVSDVSFEKKIDTKKVFILSGWYFRLVLVMCLLCLDTGTLIWSLSITVFSSHQAPPAL